MPTLVTVSKNFTDFCTYLLSSACSKYQSLLSISATMGGHPTLWVYRYVMYGLHVCFYFRNNSRIIPPLRSMPASASLSPIESIYSGSLERYEKGSDFNVCQNVRCSFKMVLNVQRISSFYKVNCARNLAVTHSYDTCDINDYSTVLINKLYVKSIF